MFKVVMKSDEFGTEEYPRETIYEALETIRRLYESARKAGDGVKRFIGVVVNEVEEDAL